MSPHSLPFGFRDTRLHFRRLARASFALSLAATLTVSILAPTSPAHADAAPTTINASPHGTVQSTELTSAQLTPKLQLRLFGNGNIGPSNTAIYEVYVSEVGGAPAQRVSVDFIASSGLNLRGLSGGGFGCGIQNPQRGRCEIPTLSAGTTRLIRLTASISDGTSGSVRIIAANNENPLRPDTPTTMATALALFRVVD
jgi:hypothetical protein